MLKEEISKVRRDLTGLGGGGARRQRNFRTARGVQRNCLEYRPQHKKTPNPQKQERVRLQTEQHTQAKALEWRSVSDQGVCIHAHMWPMDYG